MANTAQARKRARQNDDQRIRNASQRSMLRTYVKRVIKAIESGNSEQAKTEFKEAESVIDRVADKDVIHKNKAARTKSRLAARIKAMNAATA